MIATALVIGGGIGGMTAALALARRGVAVELIDADPNWRVYGAGISVTGLSLRAFDDLGILDDVRQRGHVGAGMRGRAPDGTVLFESPVPENPAPIQSGGGIMRPVLHDILSARVREAGIAVRLGVRVDRLEDDGLGVGVGFDDGAAGRYDLVIGADGINSQTRQAVFPKAPAPRFTGQGCWRAIAPRPAGFDRAEMFFGGPVKVGFNPVSDTDMYVFVLEHVPDNPWFPEDALVDHLKDLLAPFGSYVAEVREGLGPQSLVNYRPLEWLLLEEPWYKGRIVLIGDAVHATTPHMASGAGMAVEDGLVLADELARHDDIGAALAAFMARRIERARLVVENSVRIGEIEMTGGDQVEANRMLGATMARLQQAY
ncbi:FAD-dependent oxidoreductase [Novosphingobium sp. KN65.2]|uniref:FAD-dependent oxidoreductase n=1 Tax=Novosphingobium sp. KN65.2 TaxID=1478134 RepID=UPI0005DAF573|nr:FAD-dependent oxidoreductase [Novosphingobium sp. KN65.2]CDO35048.1 Monooxygenase, FAD-binding [Novosphingobium sp. KN65.2]